MRPPAHHDALTDPLIDRLRAADPYAAPEALPPLDRARIAGLHRRRAARRRLRAGAAGGALALAAMLAVALGPSGGPSDTAILVRAVQASELPANSIVRIESVIEDRDLQDPGLDYERRFTTWLRTSARGALLSYRQRITGDTDPRAVIGFEQVGTPIGARSARARSYNPRTGEIASYPRLTLPSTVFAVKVHALLSAARAGRGHRVITIRSAGHGHTTIRVLERFGTTSFASTVRQRDFTLDTTTYRPLAFTDYVRNRYKGRLYSGRLTERIVGERTLPDTPRNRRFLRLGGPTS
jgi:hypothetical protein